MDLITGGIVSVYERVGQRKKSVTYLLSLSAGHPSYEALLQRVSSDQDSIRSKVLHTQSSQITVTKFLL